MANYQSQYTGEQIDEAVGKALAGSGGNVSSASLEAVWTLKSTFDFSSVSGTITIDVGLLMYAGYYTSIKIDADAGTITVNNISHGDKVIYQNNAWTDSRYDRWVLTYVGNNIDTLSKLLTSNVENKGVALKGGYEFTIGGTYGYSSLQLTFANGETLHNTVAFNFRADQVFHHVVAVSCTISSNQAFSISCPVIYKIGTSNWEYSNNGDTYASGEYAAVLLNDGNIFSFDD